ncbi:MAG TPA: ATP-binding cassette domain-containing protein [Pseudogracilibacillus sp.]|nr:ATP-binding cassette domain-containing protein [Pseudogracilibacillus sp.]
MNAIRLRAEKVTKEFANNQGGKVTALDGLDLHITKGEFISLLGPSRCGKLTFLRLVAGLEERTSSVLELDEKSITNAGRDRKVVF